MRETLEIIDQYVKVKTILQNMSQYVNYPFNNGKIFQGLLGSTGDTHFKTQKEPA